MTGTPLGAKASQRAPIHLLRIVLAALMAIVAVRDSIDVRSAHRGWLGRRES